MIIGLAGKKGSGKNTVANLISEAYGYSQTSFAEGLRHELNYYMNNEVKSMLEIISSFEGIDSNLKDYLLSLVNKYAYKFSIRLTLDRDRKEEFRPLMQFWGTELRRDNDPDYWINMVNWKENLLITDVRFGGVGPGSEVERIQSKGGNTIYIQNPLSQTAPPEIHSSESLTPDLCDITLYWDKKDSSSCLMNLISLANTLGFEVTREIHNSWNQTLMNLGK